MVIDIILKILYTVLIFAFLIFVHELGHFLAARAVGVKVKEFAIGMGPAIFKKQKGETLFSIRCIPVGGFCSLEGEDEESDEEGSFESKGVWARIFIVCAGAIMNLLLGLILTLSIVLITEALPSTVVAEFTPNAISCNYGLQIGDKIIDINGKPVSNYTDIVVAFSRNYDNEPFDITVERNGIAVLLEDVSFPVEEANESVLMSVFDFKVYREEKSVENIIKQTFRRTWSYITMVYETIYDLLTGDAPLNYVSGPIGTSEAISTAWKSGVEDVLYITALISINLGAFNLIPLPALDGGRLTFLLIEAATRKKVKKNIEATIHFIGLVLLLILSVIIAFKDIFFPVF